jgi:hypothetical protein
MGIVRVLCLNDDNHDAQFVTEDWYIYSDVNSFITHRLAQPHTDNYEVRGFHLCDHDDIPGISEEDVIRLFDIALGRFNVPENEWRAVFETLWHHSSEWWHA